MQPSSSTLLHLSVGIILDGVNIKLINRGKIGARWDEARIFGLVAKGRIHVGFEGWIKLSVTLQAMLTTNISPRVRFGVQLEQSCR